MQPHQMVHTSRSRATYTITSPLLDTALLLTLRTYELIGRRRLDQCCATASKALSPLFLLLFTPLENKVIKISDLHTGPAHTVIRAHNDPSTVCCADASFELLLLLCSECTASRIRWKIGVGGSSFYLDSSHCKHVV